ncbi:MAG TPA: hypothetical protein VHE61_04340 [Opitutaceae bacterium]|nr:hypothetical protein [Opitutaceae bacterium]
MRTARYRGFTLVELIIGIVFVGVALAPFLVFVARIHDLNSAMGEQARIEAWRSFTDQVLAAGIDPSRAPALSSLANPGVPAVGSAVVMALSVPDIPGIAQLQPLRSTVESVAESRSVGAGFQLGTGVAITARTTPTSPLVPIVMPAPVITPPDGSLIDVATLVATDDGSPYGTVVRADGATGTRVILAFNHPTASVSGAPVATRTITAVDLANKVDGAAWSEFPGDTSLGTSVVLADGRTRWLVRRTDGRQQIYEPSLPVAFSYTIGLGSPVLVSGAVEHSTGASLVFDYSTYEDVQAGRLALRIDFPSTAKAAFGVAWKDLPIGFNWTFHDAPGPFSGDVASFFQPDALTVWADTVSVVATPVVPPGASIGSGNWTLIRKKTELGMPLLADAADIAGFFPPGAITFNAPVGPEGVPIGRLSFDSGAYVSTGPTISIPVIP